MYPWHDYNGRLSPFKLAVFVALFAPALWTAVAYVFDWLGAEPRTEAIHEIGIWTLRFIFLALAVTPLRAVLQWPRLMVVRRMLGVAAAAYALTHLTLYIVDQSFDLVTVATEIVLRIYLTLGFIALLGLSALAATSTDGMMRRLGRRWARLHQLVYPIAFIAVIHFSMQSKLEQWEPAVMGGLYLWLMGYRGLAWAWGGANRLPLWPVALLGALAAALTALGEAVYFWLSMDVDPLLVLDANLTTETGLRPSWVVFAITAAVTLFGMARLLFARKPRLRPRTA